VILVPGEDSSTGNVTGGRGARPLCFKRATCQDYRSTAFSGEARVGWPVGAGFFLIEDLGSRLYRRPLFVFALDPVMAWLMSVGCNWSAHS
jgi:hypothetical protein